MHYSSKRRAVVEGCRRRAHTQPKPCPKGNQALVGHEQDLGPVKKSSSLWSTQPAAAFSLPPPAAGSLWGLRALSPGLAGELWPSHARGGFLPRSPGRGRGARAACAVTVPRVATSERHSCPGLLPPRPPAWGDTHSPLLPCPEPCGAKHSAGGCCPAWSGGGHSLLPTSCWSVWALPWIWVSSAIIYPEVPSPGAWPKGSGRYYGRVLTKQ